MGNSFLLIFSLECNIFKLLKIKIKKIKSCFLTSFNVHNAHNMQKMCSN